MADILIAAVTTLGWVGMLVVYMLVKAQGQSASIMLKNYVRLNLLSWSTLILIQSLYYLQLDFEALGKNMSWLSLISHQDTGQVAFRSLLALSIWNFIRNILQPQTIITIPLQEAQIQMDAYGLIVAWDESATKLFGWQASEVIGHVLAEKIIPLRYREFHQQGLNHFRKTTEAPILDKRLTFPACTKENGEIIVELRVKENLTSQGTIFTAMISPAVVLK